ncbi:MAG: DUF1800 domain-containing protein [Planctomycetes bacterium]|nr:DUF1800 domain-containing protein [Planctomycetota bacterium]
MTRGAGIGRVSPRFGVFVVALATLGACGGGGSGGASGGPSYVQGSDVPATDADAACFLTQSTFGPTHDDIDLLRFIGYAAWFDDQRAKSVSKERPYVNALDAAGKSLSQNHRMQIWWDNALTGDDQLRQRVAWALSQIFVISDQHSSLSGDVKGLCEYYDILARDAFGNYRKLLEDVTLSPQMGMYLNMLRNEKADPAYNIRPDENYAREILQLFSIGLVQLAVDGTPLLDGLGATIPTYDQSVVEGFAATFTGWTFADAKNWWDWEGSTKPMVNWPDYHETAAKVILNSVVVPAGQTGEQDLALALDTIFAHPNVGPFFSKLLIQRLVTSNPTPAYVGRVASVFDDDGTGERGDLFEVVKAILMDDEARNGHLTMPATFGKVKEPIVRQTQLWRALDAKAKSGKYKVYWPDYYFGQAPLRSPTVFNFYSSTFSPPGDLADNGLAAPELQIATHSLIALGTNEFYDLVFWGNSDNTNDDADTVEIDLKPLKPLAVDPTALVDELGLLLMAGDMSSAMHQVLVDHVAATPITDGGTQRVLEAVYLIVTSPEGAVQK